jgi:hypothetical protein
MAGDPDGEQAPDDENVIQIPEDQTQTTSTKPDVDQSNKPSLAYCRREEPLKLIWVAIQCIEPFSYADHHQPQANLHLSRMSSHV